MSADRLLIFCKAPVPGYVKTRLVPALTPVAAASLYEASLRDTAALAARERGRVELWFDAPPDFEWSLPVELAQIPMQFQVEGDLGERQRDAFERSFADGAERVIVLGSDCPTLPESHLNAAFDAIHDAPAAIGPTHDGGYYLLALQRSVWPRAGALLEEVPWSTPDVLSHVLRRAQMLDLELRTLPGWYDVDLPADLALLAADVTEQSHVGQWLRQNSQSVP